MKYYFSRSQNAFYPEDMKSSYISSGNFPNDTVLVSEQEFHEYSLSAIPTDKKRGSTSAGKPCWIDDIKPEKPLSQLKEEKLKAINNSCENLLSSLRNTYPVSEQLSWDRQIQEAERFLADATYDPKLLKSIAKGRNNMDVGVLSQKVIDKANIYVSLSGEAFGKRQALEELIDAATSKEELDLIVW